jgi:hypothetical protein
MAKWGIVPQNGIQLAALVLTQKPNYECMENNDK